MKAALLLVLAACGGEGATRADAQVVVDSDPSAPDAMPREIIMETQSLDPGELVEGIMTGGTTDSAFIQLMAPSANIGWNIHGHDGGGTQVVHEEFDQMTVGYEFKPTSTTDWYLLVRNDGGVTMDIQVKVQLFGAMTWEWQ